MLRILSFLLAIVAASAHAEVTSSSPTSFLLSYRVDSPATPEQAFRALGRVGQWWNAQHTYSGKATNLRLVLRAGDCLCEAWDGNSVEHARVLYVERNAKVRLAGALGPLQELGVNGILTFTTGTAEGRHFMQMTYLVSGVPDADLHKLAPVVDRVMGEQFARWTEHAGGAKP